jgi:hypothetical protein
LYLTLILTHSHSLLSLNLQRFVVVKKGKAVVAKDGNLAFLTRDLARTAFGQENCNYSGNATTFLGLYDGAPVFACKGNEAALMFDVLLTDARQASAELIGD